LNIQTERLENHTARFTVEVDVTRLENAKQVAARRLSKQVNIPGFRKGKAPYRILANYIGEGAILEDAIEVLGNEVYKESLDQSDIEPYGPGALEDFKVEPAPTFTFVVPLQPTVVLNDYRSVRLDYESPKIEDEDVGRAMQILREQHAVIEESQKPVAIGDRITVDIHSYFVDDQAEDTEFAEADAPEAGDEPEEYIHQHDMIIMLSDDTKREVAPGFNKAMEGASVGDEREFEITYPDDEEEYDEVAARRVKFEVDVKKIETVTLPALNDDFAARVTSEEEKPLTLLELRIRMRENLQKSAEARSTSEFAREALDAIVEQATVSYPEALVHDQIHRILDRLDNDLRQRGLTLDDYMKISGKSHEDLHVDYHDTAIETIKRSLVLREVVQAENMAVSEDSINDQIDTILSRFGEQSENLRPLFDEPTMRNSVKNDLLEQQVLERIAAIAKGEALPVVSQHESGASEPVTQEGESA
jgi:trigger factor